MCMSLAYRVLYTNNVEKMNDSYQVIMLTQNSKFSRSYIAKQLVSLILSGSSMAFTNSYKAFLTSL